MLDGMSDSIQGSRIENLHSREVDRQSPTGLIFSFWITGWNIKYFHNFLVYNILKKLNTGNVTNLPTSPTNWCHTTLGNAEVIFQHDSTVTSTKQLIFQKFPNISITVTVLKQRNSPHYSECSKYIHKQKHAARICHYLSYSSTMHCWNVPSLN